MSIIKFDPQSPYIKLSGEEDMITNFTQYYAKVTNFSQEKVYVSKETFGGNTASGNAFEIPANEAKVFAVDAANNRFFAKGTGTIYVERFDNSVTDGGNTSSLLSQCPHDEMLINPDFVVNQRSKTEYLNEGKKTYTVDQWYMTSGSMKVTLNADGTLTVSRTAQGGYPMFCQEVERSFQAGEQYTLSLKYKSSSGVYKAGVVFENSAGEWSNNKINRIDLKNDGEWHTLSVTAEVPDGYTNGAMVYLHDLAGSVGTINDSVVLQYMKLEHGSIATPFAPPNPVTELAKCQRYLLPLHLGSCCRADCITADSICFSIPTPTSLKSGIPTILYPENLAVYSLDGTEAKEGFSFSCWQTENNGSVYIEAQKDSHGLTDVCLKVINGTVLISSEE